MGQFEARGSVNGVAAAGRPDEGDIRPAYNPDQAEGEDREIGGGGTGGKADEDAFRRRRPGQAEGEDPGGEADEVPREE